MSENFIHSGVWCCSEKSQCQWQGFALHQGIAWGTIGAALDEWRKRHDENCRGRLIQLIPPSVGPTHSKPSPNDTPMSENDWRPISELGDFEYLPDGGIRWTLNEGYDEMMLFLVYLSGGDIETHLASIDDGGTLCDPNGDDVGWQWYDATYFMRIPERPERKNHE